MGKVYNIWGEVRNKTTGQSWEEELLRVIEGELEKVNQDAMSGGRGPWNFSDGAVLVLYLETLAADVVAQFNATRRPHEPERELVRSWVKVEDGGTSVSLIPDTSDIGILSDADLEEPEGYDGDYDD